MTKPLFKTTIVIWSEYDGSNVELSDLAWQAERGDAICTKQDSEKVENPNADPDFGETEFFDDDEDSFDALPYEAQQSWLRGMEV